MYCLVSPLALHAQSGREVEQDRGYSDSKARNGQKIYTKNQKNVNKNVKEIL